jgi:hypothetical protein
LRPLFDEDSSAELEGSGSTRDAEGDLIWDCCFSGWTFLVETLGFLTCAPGFRGFVCGSFVFTIDAERCADVGKILKVIEKSHESKATDKEILGVWSRTITNLRIRGQRFAHLLSEISFHLS